METCSSKAIGDRYPNGVVGTRGLSCDLLGCTFKGLAERFLAVAQTGSQIFTSRRRTST